MKLLSYVVGTIVHPITTSQKVYSDKRKMGYAFAVTLVGSALMALSELPASVRTDSPHPWALPFFVPLFLVIWAVPSLWIFVFCAMLKGKGKVDETMAVLAFPLALFMVVFALVTYPENFLSSSGIVTQSAYKGVIEPGLLLAAAAWALTVSVFFVRTVHSFSHVKSVLAVLLAVVTGTPLFYFIAQI